MHYPLIHEVSCDIAGTRDAALRESLEQLLKNVADHMVGIEISPVQQYSLGNYLFYHLDHYCAAHPDQSLTDADAMDRLRQDAQIGEVLSLALTPDVLLKEAAFWGKEPECLHKLRQLSHEVFELAKAAYSKALLKEIEDELDLPEEASPLDAELGLHAEEEWGDGDEVSMPLDPQAYREECLERLAQIDQAFSRREDPYVDWESYPEELANERSEIFLDLDTICGETRILSLRLGREQNNDAPNQASRPKSREAGFSQFFHPRP